MRSDGHPPCSLCGRVRAAEFVRQRLGTARARLAELATPQEIAMLKAGIQVQGPRALLALDAAATVKALEAVLVQLRDQGDDDGDGEVTAPRFRMFPGHLPEDDDDTSPSGLVIELDTE